MLLMGMGKYRVCKQGCFKKHDYIRCWSCSLTRVYIQKALTVACFKIGKLVTNRHLIHICSNLTSGAFDRVISSLRKIFRVTVITVHAFII